MIGAAWTVLRKELRDALRDRRTLLTIVLSSVAVGPLVLVLLSTLVAGMEERAESREIVVAGIEHAPTLRNYLERQTYRVSAAPAQFEQQLRSKRLGEPVLVIPAGFEADLARGEPPRVELVLSSANPRSQAGASRLARLLQGFAQEQAMLRLAWRGVSPASLQAIEVDERDLASPAARAAQWATLVPFFMLMAVLYGALHAALDSTAGERERGSLEPLLLNPVSPLALVLGKWAAVAAVAMLIAVLSCASFLPGQWLLRSETLAAMFRFGVGEGAMFLALLLPLAGALSALLMAIAIRCRSVKEAQANATALVLVVSLLPLLTLFNQDGEAPWHLSVPALAQITLMGRVLKGESIAAWELALPLAVSALLVSLCLAFVARSLRGAAMK
ncbi:MAG: ABC transporter permease subunit [Burkholderiaceae bacterium]|nr:ABC transporter permease subunit [Burkholderiaceae bacterium]